MFRECFKFISGFTSSVESFCLPKLPLNDFYLMNTESVKLKML